MNHEFDRRTFLAGLGAVGLSGLLPSRDVEAQTTRESTQANPGLPAPAGI